jgi:hypothetical protein
MFDQDLADAQAEMARLNARIVELERREKAYLSELHDYGLTTQRLNRKEKATETALASFRAYLEDNCDTEDGHDGPRANWAMRALQEFDAALAGKGVKFA